MKNILVIFVTLFISLFVLVLSLVLFIPLSIIALITGKKIQRNGFRFQPNRRDQANQAEQNDSGRPERIIEGDYQDISDKAPKD